MELVVLDRIPLDVGAEPVTERLDALEAEVAALEPLAHLVSEGVALARPRAAYRLASVAAGDDGTVIIDGTALRSRILSVHLREVARAFPFVVTCGRELAAWAGAQTDLAARFLAEAIMERALAGASRTLAEELARRYALDRTGTMTPGSLGDWPIEEQVPLFALLGDVEGAIGVRLTDGLMMEPVHSLSGLIFPTAEAFEECRLCPRARCPKRRAPFEERLYEERYGGIARD